MYSSNRLFWRNIHFVFATSKFWCTRGKSFVFNMVTSWEWKTDSFDNVLVSFESSRRGGNFFKTSSGLNYIIPHVLNPNCKLEPTRFLIYSTISRENCGNFSLKWWLRLIFFQRFTTFHEASLKSLNTATSNGCDRWVVFGGRRINATAAISLV